MADLTSLPVKGSDALRVAVVGAGPAGVYFADALVKAGLPHGRELSIDLFDQYPAPFGLIRYGVAPDHPRIKGIIQALHQVLDRGDLRFFGNVRFGSDLGLEDLQRFYDVVVFATGAVKDAALNLPGVELEGSYGAADFVAWYDGNPDVGLDWTLDAASVAVIGNGNVALDIARILSKPAQDLLSTEIPENVYKALRDSSVKDVHLFGRRGPAQVKFTPLELRELSQVRDVDIVLYPEDFVFDAASEQAIQSNNQVRNMMNTLGNWLAEQPEVSTASRRLHFHFLHTPVEIVGKAGRVSGMTFERMELDGQGQVRGTGHRLAYDVQAVYRAVGYFGSPLPGLPYDVRRGIIPNDRGRILDDQGQPIAGLYTVGWVKRGPVGLIGHTKGDALETVACVLDDIAHSVASGHALTQSTGGASDHPEAIGEFLQSRGIDYTTWEGWLLLDAHERALGQNFDAQPWGMTVERERIKVVSRADMVRVARASSLQSQSKSQSNGVEHRRAKPNA